MLPTFLLIKFIFETMIEKGIVFRFRMDGTRTCPLSKLQEVNQP